MDWIIAHAALVTGLVVALLDFAFAISPGLEANGILHAIYGWLKPAPKG